MTRFNVAILIAVLFALFASLTTVSAAQNTTELRSVTITDFKIDTDGNGTWFGALHSADGDSVKAIKFTAYGKDYEDYFPAYGDTLTMTLNINTNGYTGYASIYSDEYAKFVTVRYSDYTDNEHIIGYIETVNGITHGTLDGVGAQFTGFVQNGECIVIRRANAYSTSGFGWIVQNGNLIRYVTANDEEPVTPTPTPTPTHTIVLPLIML